MVKTDICYYEKKGGEKTMSERKWVYGTRNKKWVLVSKDDRDYKVGISQERIKKIGRTKAKKEYLSGFIMR